MNWEDRPGTYHLGYFRSLDVILCVIDLSIQAQKILRSHIFPGVHFIFFTQVYFSSCLFNSSLLVTGLLTDTWSQCINI